MIEDDEAVEIKWVGRKDKSQEDKSRDFIESILKRKHKLKKKSKERSTEKLKNIDSIESLKPKTQIKNKMPAPLNFHSC